MFYYWQMSVGDQSQKLNRTINLIWCIVRFYLWHLHRYFQKASCFKDGGYFTRYCTFVVEFAAFASFYFCYPCRSLQRTLNELKEYQKQHDHYLHQQETLDKYKLLQEEQILRNIIHETQMAKEAQLGMTAFNDCIKTQDITVSFCYSWSAREHPYELIKI